MQGVEASRTGRIPILFASQLDGEFQMRQRIGGRVPHHGVQMRQCGLRALDLGKYVGQFHVGVEQIVGNQHGALTLGGEHAVVDHPFRIGVEVARHARIGLEQLVHATQCRFDHLYGLIDLAAEQQITGLHAFGVKIVGQSEREVRRIVAVDQRTGHLCGESRQFRVADGVDDVHRTLCLGHGGHAIVGGQLVELPHGALQQIDALD